MTKAQEVEALRQFTASLPNDTYLKPWLRSVLAEVEQEIRSDFPVSPSLASTRRRCELMQADVKREGEAIITMARQKAEATEKAALKFAQSVRENIAAKLREQLRVLEN